MGIVLCCSAVSAETIRLRTIGTAGARGAQWIPIDGERGLGHSSSGVGDVNGDGYEDFVIGSTSLNLDPEPLDGAYLVYGHPDIFNEGPPREVSPEPQAGMLAFHSPVRGGPAGPNDLLGYH